VARDAPLWSAPGVEKQFSHYMHEYVLCVCRKDNIYLHYIPPQNGWFETQDLGWGSNFFCLKYLC
jgi:hypothetical protein